MEEVDVAIVGGGPGGSAAGRAAALNGADVVVFERGVPRADRDELGPDSTDAAGFLDYWVDIAGIDPDTIPEGVIQQVLDQAEFNGPSESLTLRETGFDTSYPNFGFTFHRARFDDWLRDRAEDAGAEYRVGSGVRSIDVAQNRTGTHRLSLADGSSVEATSLILADGPQRQQTMPVLDAYLPESKKAKDLLSPRTANHVAYQEYRRFPEDVFEPRTLKFWWGWIPGHTAYPWIFPNQERIGRVGLTMPIGIERADLARPTDYTLVRKEDETLPTPSEYIRRLLDRLYGDEYDIASDFPVLTDDHGKDEGTETYAISSTRPIESPTDLNIAVVGGAMGATSAFHEGGDHLALRTGALAGELAATDSLSMYNQAWQEAVGAEVLRNVALAELVRGYRPPDWDRVLAIGRRMLRKGDGGIPVLSSALSTGISALRLYVSYRWQRFKYGSGRFCQIQESDYRIE
ncbi:MAG: NAD(P)/FAD-dependent oxidoreductase [Halodesulfurarchaeum sp.]